MDKRSGSGNQKGSGSMRIGYAVAVAALLAGSPAMAQVIIGGGDNDAARHEYRADQDRAAGRQEMNEARGEAARGDYRDAARDQTEAHHDWNAARHQEQDAARDSNGGVTVELGH
jgi:hypothetical protein